MGTIVIVTYRFEVVVGMHFRNSKSTTLILFEQSQLFRTFPLSIQLLYEHDVLQSEKKKNKRKPDDFITVIKEGKVSSSFPVSIKLIPFIYDVITQAKLTCFFHFRRHDH